MTQSGITADVLGAGLDRIPQDKQGAILAEFPRLAERTVERELIPMAKALGIGVTAWSPLAHSA